MKHLIRNYSATAILCSVLLINPNGFATAQVIDRLSYEDYTVIDRPGQDLNKSINQHSPIYIKNRVFQGFTNYTLAYDYKNWQEHGGSCKLTSHNIYLNVTITLPKLYTSDRKTREQFDAQNLRLHNHELEHYAISKRGAARFDAALRTLNAAPNCEALKRDIHTIHSKILKEIDNENASFDERTQHGAVSQ